MTATAVIPTRGGSVGLPGKCLAKLGSSTLLGHAIQQALRTVGRAVVITDSETHVAEAEQHGATALLTPWKQDATEGPEVKESWALETYPEAFGPASHLVRLFVTQPLRADEDIHHALAMCVRQGAQVVSVSSASFQDHQLVQDAVSPGYARMRWEDPLVPRQSVPDPVSYVNGVVYAGPRDQVRRYGFLPPRFFPISIPSLRALDIDTRKDLEAVRKLWPIRRSLWTL